MAPINTDPSRRKSSGRRKSSAVVDIPTEHVDTKNLSDADKRLAEMGYVQVSPSPISLPLNSTFHDVWIVNGSARLTLRLEHLS